MYTYKNVTLKEIKKSVSRVVVRRNIKQLQRRERERDRAPKSNCLERLKSSIADSVTLGWITAGLSNDPENVHLGVLLGLDTKTAGRVWRGLISGL